MMIAKRTTRASRSRKSCVNRSSGSKVIATGSWRWRFGNFVVWSVTGQTFGEGLKITGLTTPLPPMAPAPVPGPVYPVPRTPMCDARRYRSLFSRHRVAPPTPPPPSPPPSDEEPSAETYDPAADLEGDPDEPYVAEQVPYGAPEAYYSDASYGSERESASAVSAPSSHH
ncbi:hypothetical protein PIB30_058517 [Stylosanthes scabra]|uniref:Uncharacterized protein n=1 Tax=Stylosanthes scabra TaxID=79078 RepID=A0ABU6XLH8_9FABA|nr:hypothetical protein [Stylosanthes scabra]